MLVVTDTTPINYLVLIGYVDILPSLYSHVVIPQAVVGDLQHPRTPETVSYTHLTLPTIYSV